MAKIFGKCLALICKRLADERRVELEKIIVCSLDRPSKLPALYLFFCCGWRQPSINSFPQITNYHIEKTEQNQQKVSQLYLSCFQYITLRDRKCWRIPIEWRFHHPQRKVFPWEIKIFPWEFTKNGKRVNSLSSSLTILLFYEQNSGKKEENETFLGL